MRSPISRATRKEQLKRSKSSNRSPSAITNVQALVSEFETSVFRNEYRSAVPIPIKLHASMGWCKLSHLSPDLGRCRIQTIAAELSFRSSLWAQPFRRYDVLKFSLKDFISPPPLPGGGRGLYPPQGVLHCHPQSIAKVSFKSDIHPTIHLTRSDPFMIHTITPVTLAETLVA